MSGGYDPTQTDPDSKFFKAVLAAYTKLGAAPLVGPRNPGSWPGLSIHESAAEPSGRSIRAWAWHGARMRRMSII